MKRLLFVSAVILSLVGAAAAMLIPDRPKDSRGMLKWEYDNSSTADTDPGTGKIKFNHATQAVATALYIDDTSSTGAVMDSTLAALERGDILYIQDQFEHDEFLQFIVTDTSVDRTGWWRVPVDAFFASAASPITDADTVTIELFVRDRGGFSDTATYLTTLPGGAEWVAYNSITNDVLPSSDNFIDIGTQILRFRDMQFSGFIRAQDSVVTSVISSIGRTWTIWFWDGAHGPDSLLIGVDTLNGWLMACDGDGDCIPLTRDSLISNSLDSVMRFMDRNGGGLDTPYVHILDSTTQDILRLVADSPKFRIYSDSILQVGGRLVTMIGDTTWGIGYIDLKSHVVFHFLDTVSSVVRTYQLSDTINGPLGNNWALTVDSANGRLIFEAQVGGGSGGGTDTTAVYQVAVAGAPAVPYSQLFSDDSLKFFPAGSAMTITTDSVLKLIGKMSLIIGDTTFGQPNFIDIAAMLRFRFLNAGTTPDSIFYYRWVDSMANFLGDGWVATIDSVNRRIVWAAPPGAGSGMPAADFDDSLNAQIDPYIKTYIDSTTLDTIQNAHKAVFADSAENISDGAVDASDKIAAGAVDFGTDVNTFLSSVLFGRLTDETGSGSGTPLAVFNQNPTIDAMIGSGTFDLSAVTLDLTGAGSVTFDNDEIAEGEIAQGTLDSTEVADGGLAIEDMAWDNTYVYLSNVHGWGRVTGDSVWLHWNLHDASSSWLLRDSVGTDSPSDDTVMVSGVIPWPCTLDSLTIFYKVSSGSEIEDIDLRGPDLSTFTNLTDSTWFSDATDLTSTTYAAAHYDLGDEAAAVGYRFALKYILSLDADNDHLCIGWIRLKVKRTG